MSQIFPDRFHRAVPAGDDHERMVCRDCNFIHYDNPKMIAGAVVSKGDQLLLCKRAIDPQKNLWTLPAGFMELGETPAEGAAREAMEEACAAIDIKDMLAIYTVKRISQVQIFYRATLTSDIAPGPESTEVALFDWQDIPWDKLAFPSVVWALKDFDKVRNTDKFPPFTNPPEWADL